MDREIAASLEAYAGTDEEFVERAFREILRRPADEESRTRALGMLAARTSTQTQGDGVVEIPWVLSRLVPSGRVVEVGYAYAEAAYLAGLLRGGVELVGVDLAERDVEGMERVTADVRSLSLPDDSVDQVLLVSTLEHVGADNTDYGLDAEDDPGSRADGLRELRRVLAPNGSLLVTVPLGEPGDHGWFRLDDVPGWTTLFTSAGFFVEEQETYELTGEGWRSVPSFDPQGVGYGDRGPAASAVLCTELSPGRLRRLATPGGLARTVKRRTRAVRHRG